MDKSFNPQAIEQHWYARWEQNGWFSPCPGPRPYCIMLPPPNVTGSLHMGHGFQHTLMDLLTRYHRMQGDETLWQPGTDHAGIATQMVVERQLAAEGISRHDLGREAFLEKVWEWKAQSGGTITRQMRRLGASVDWSRERFTMDEGLSAAVRKVFVQLYREGLIYRGKRLVNWDPVLHTALSDLEVENHEEKGHLWHLRYPRSDGQGFVVVATTRPETMLGDQAVAVHPDDERYRDLVGKTVELPLTGRRIPVIADDYVDPEFGSGCVKITPAHDFNDYEVGQRHGLPLLNIFTEDARINDQAPEAYRGLDRYEAREKIIADLEARGLLEKTEDHTLQVPRGDRSGVVVEPYLTDQWYVDLTREMQADGRPGGRKAITEPAIAAVRDGRIRFVPENWDKTYYNWLNDIQDWCISRQLWWGHRIPAWYDADGNIYVGESEAEVRAHYGLADDLPLQQDEDVLDTWFSSALWPFSTLGWPENTPELDTFYPTNVLVTGFDIIFFWVARMIMMGLKFMDDVPFREVYITGLVRDAHGQKMSKSKGNVLDPIDLIDGIDLESLVAKRTHGMMQPKKARAIEKATRKEFPEGIRAYGTDAVRFTFTALATNGRDIRFDLGRVEGYRNFCNKIWNAARYVLMNCEGQPVEAPENPAQLPVADRWILGRLAHAVEQTRAHIDAYRMDLAAQSLYEFIWNEYCDWYLELSKPALNEGDENTRARTRWTLLTVLESALRLLHPVMPFITEEIWQRVAPLLGRQGPSIQLAPYPKAEDYPRDAQAEADIHWLQQVVTGVRRIRAEMNIAPGKPLPLLLAEGSPEEQARAEILAPFIRTLARLESLRPLQPGETEPEAATALAGETRLLIPLAGVIDKDAELQRLDKEIARLEKEVQRAEGKLSNEKFTARAPAEVVEQERQRLAEYQGALERLAEQKTRLQRL